MERMKWEEGNYNPERMRELNKMVLMSKVSIHRKDASKIYLVVEREPWVIKINVKMKLN